MNNQHPPDSNGKDIMSEIFQIERTDDQITIRAASDNTNRLVLDIGDLLRLQRQITQLLAAELSGVVSLTAPTARRIGVAEAVALAEREHGIQLKGDTVLAACRRGGLKEAKKEGARWTFPVWAFTEWLDVHERRKNPGAP